MAFSLFNHGLLGINARNLLYIKPFNPKKAIAFADDKLKTKAFLAARGIPVAKIYGRIETREQLQHFDFRKLPDDCVLKPNSGFGGEGIIVLQGRKNGQFLKQGKEPITEKEMREHIEDILDGKYALGGQPDTAFFEQLLIPHEAFSAFRPMGLPDIRVIVFNLVPVMAMLRIPTQDSEGKANVHLGGLGIGIDIAKGVTTHATQYNRIVKELPYGGSPAGHKIPYWEEILLVSSRIQQITNLGYLAVDITLDQHMGPALLEVNARAGLMVQVANLAPLRSRLRRVEGLSVGTPEKGVRMGQDLFGQKVVAKPKENVQDKPILGVREVITIMADGTSVDVPCLITPERERTAFDARLIDELKTQGGALEESETSGTYRVKMMLGGRKIQTLVQADSIEDPDARALVGRRDLAGFLVDPMKERGVPRHMAKRSNLRALDRLCAQIDGELPMLKWLKPVNIMEERARALEDIRYNPLLQYPTIPFDVSEGEKRLQEAASDDSPLGILLEKKRQELLLRIQLLRARGNADTFTRLSKELFGEPSSALVRAAQAALNARPYCDLPSKKTDARSAEETAEALQEALNSYGLHNWEVSVRQRLIADCTVGGHTVYVREGAEFSSEHIASLIAHEIETHALTSENGSHQPYDLLRRGCAGYLDTQEGLAIYNQNRTLSEGSDRRYNAPRNILGLAFSLRHSFAETRAYLEEEIGFKPEKALTQAFAMKRGLADTKDPGGFTKSIVYFRGLRAVEEFAEKGGDLRRLYVGKISLEDLELIEQVPELRPALLLPKHLR